jgi:hypothetical protein
MIARLVSGGELLLRLPKRSSSTLSSVMDLQLLLPEDDNKAKGQSRTYAELRDLCASRHS